MNNDYLAHHGIKGQKWGVRRYQNEDGTLKSAGRKRQKPESATWKSRDARKLSDEELIRRNNRLQKENQYRQNVDNAHGVRKEIRQAAKKILLYSAVGVVSGIMAANYKKAFAFIGSKCGRKKVSNIASLITDPRKFAPHGGKRS